MDKDLKELIEKERSRRELADEKLKDSEMKYELLVLRHELEAKYRPKVVDFGLSGANMI
jgi:hypothetical protein